MLFLTIFSEGMLNAFNVRIVCDEASEASEFVITV